MTGDDLRKAREGLGLTQDEFAELLGLSTRTIQRKEAAKSLPRIYRMAADWLEHVTGKP